MDFVNKKILVIAAHPDDAELGCGGVLAMAANTHVFILGAQHHRDNETAAAAKILGFLPIVKHYQDKYLINSMVDMIGDIEAQVEKLKPEIVITHYMDDTHQDHRAVCNATLSALREYRGTVLFFKSPSTLSFEPNVFVELPKAAAELKKRAVRAHESQAGKPYLTSEAIDAALCSCSANYRSAPIHVEPFKLFRMVCGNPWG